MAQNCAARVGSTSEVHAGYQLTSAWLAQGTVQAPRDRPYTLAPRQSHLFIAIFTPPQIAIASLTRQHGMSTHSVWDAYLADNGQTYYHNPSTGKTSWELPDETPQAAYSTSTPTRCGGEHLGVIRLACSLVSLPDVMSTPPYGTCMNSRYIAARKRAQIEFGRMWNFDSLL